MAVRTLDYPAEKLSPFGREKIVLDVTSDVENLYRIHACAKEPWTVDAIESLAPGECLWDIGANVGSYTLLGAARGLRVVAIEPHFASYAALCRNLGLNELLADVIALPVAAWAESGLLWFHLADALPGSAGHLLGTSDRKVSFHRQLILGLTLDQLFLGFGLPAPHGLKLDVDGYEREVLAGAQELLAQQNLRCLIVEVRLDWEEELVGWLADRGFPLVARFDRRGEADLGPICYGRFERRPGGSP